MDPISQYASMLAVILTVLGTVGTLTWWLSTQFSSTKNLFYVQLTNTKEAILSKLEYHERHDDERFSAVSNDLWSIRLRNAAIDGVKLNKRIGGKTIATEEDNNGSNP